MSTQVLWICWAASYVAGEGMPEMRVVADKCQ
jgi:hypothetical protein